MSTLSPLPNALIMPSNDDRGSDGAILEHWEACLAQCRYRWRTEKDLQLALGDRLFKAGFPMVMEHPLNPDVRFDLWCDGWVIEVKIKDTLMKALRQCQKYAELDEVKGVLLVTACPWDLSFVPERLNGKPLRVMHVQRNFL